MLRVGLTGSIGVGKTFVTGVFAELGAQVMDADQVAREVVAPGSPALERIAAEFGPEVISSDGTLDRQKLGDIVFSDASRRQRLNSITHPFIIHEQDLRLRRLEAAAPRGIAIVDAALMIESGGAKRFDKLIVVHCRPEIQIDRLMKRSNLSRADAERRIASQLSQNEKMAFADYLIDTSDGFDSTRQQTEEVYHKLLADAERSGKDSLP
jgi:dephospho-CoA kinase